MINFYKYKYYLYPVLILVILTILLLILNIFQADSVKLVEEEKKIPIKTKVIFPEEIRPEFLFFGRVAGKNEIDVVSRLSGKIIFVSKKLFNSQVINKKEVLFKLDSFEFQQDLIKKKSSLDELKIQLDKSNTLLAESKKQLKLAEEDYQRKSKLFGNTVSQKALDDSALKVSKAKTQLSQEEYKVNSIKINIKEAEANFKIAKNNLSFTEYKVPFAGKITGSSIDIGSEIISGVSLARLINTSELEVKFFVGEGKFTELGTNNDLIGKKIKIRWNKSTFNKLYDAELIRIDSVINEEAAGLNMYAKIQNISENDPIRPGVFVEVLFAGNAIKNSIQVPESAVYEDKFIFILVGDKPARLDIKVQGYLENQLILSGNFQRGSRVILTRLDNFQSSNSYYSITN